MSLIRSVSVGVMLTLCVLAWSSAQGESPPASSDCVAGITETTPSIDFTVLEGGAVVRHHPTGLEWRRCAEEMIWTGSDCEGTALTMTWRGALQHAHDQTGWRLPNINELLSIVEHCRSNPAINQQVFPNTPSSPHFWSASPTAVLSIYAWYIDFNAGGSFNWPMNFSGSVRLVRGGEQVSTQGMSGRRLGIRVENPLGSVLEGPYYAAIGDGVEFELGLGSVVRTSVDIDDYSISFDYSRASSGNFSTSAFNGYIITMENDDVIFNNVIIDAQNTTLDLANDRLSFDASSIYINVSGLRYSSTSRIRLNVSIR